MSFNEQPPRVLHVITRLDSGGSATNTIISADRLREHGFATSLISGRTHDPDGKIQAGLEQAGLPVYMLPSLVRNPAPLRDLLALSELTRMLRAGPFDLVHTHTSKAGILGRLAAKRAGIPVVHTAHGHIFYGYFSNLATSLFTVLERRAAKCSAALISLTDDETRECLSRQIGRPEQYVTIPSGVPLAKFMNIPPEDGQALRRQYQITEAETVFVSIGRLVPVKGFDILLTAFAKAEMPAARLIIVGAGPEAAALQDQATAAGIRQRVIFTGEQKCVRAALSAADAFVLASRNEGMGRVIVEAMAARLPVAAAKVGGIPTVLQHEQHGLLVEPENPAELAAAMERLYKHPELRLAWGAAAAKHVCPDYSEDTMIKKLAELYRRVLWQKQPQNDLTAAAV